MQKNKDLEKMLNPLALNIGEQEAALRYGPSVHWFRRARWAGGGPTYIKLAGRVLYPVAELDKFFIGKFRKSTSDPGDSADIQGER